MLQNLRDWKTTLPAVAFVLIVFGMNLLKAKHPEFHDAIDNAEAGLVAVAGGGAALGARSGQ